MSTIYVGRNLAKVAKEEDLEGFWKEVQDVLPEDKVLFIENPKPYMDIALPRIFNLDNEELLKIMAFYGRNRKY